MARRPGRRVAPPPRRLVVIARLVAAMFAYLAVLFMSALLLYVVGLMLIAGPAQGPFALVSLGGTPCSTAPRGTSIPTRSEPPSSWSAGCSGS
ncbi:MAG: hypothetical protein LC797_22470 [Chloroflexi bacterium]|nr:hypothetical protein [Chloroflexota bacterium]